MTRWFGIGAAAVLVALVALAVVSTMSAPPENAATTADRLAAELRCPDCQALSVAESHTRAAIEIRERIDAMVAEGRSPSEVRAYFADRYGDWILLSPPSPLPWLIPVLVLLLGGAGLVAWRGSRSRVATGERSVASAPDAEASRRVREEVEALDA